MLTTQWRRGLRRFTTGRPASVRRRRGHRQPLALNAPAEVLESRQLLTGGPFLQFVQQPSNAIAGHGLSSFTVDVMVPVTVGKTTTSEVDTSFPFTGYTVVANGPGVLVVPANSTTEPPNAPVGIAVDIIHGVGEYLQSWNFIALDVAGTYTLTAYTPAGEGYPAVAGKAVSNTFTVSPDTATDHLVFVGVGLPVADFPTSVTVAVEDQFGNIDKSVSNVQVTLLALPGTTSTATLEQGEATFNDVYFFSAGSDQLFAFGIGGPNGVLVGDTNVNVLTPLLNS
jgi:hypothetical protein